MKRRGFFTALAGAAAGTAATAKVVVVEESKPLFSNGSGTWSVPNDLPDVIDYNEFTITWTGWKPSAQALEKAGQWIARPRDGKPIISSQHPWGCEGIYSSFPGGVGYFLTGNHFDTCFWDGQREAVDNSRTWYDDPKLRLKAQRYALANLKKFIRENC